MEPVIVIEHVCKRFGANVVLNDFNLVVGKEENVVVLGKSGSGKSGVDQMYHRLATHG